MAKRVKSKFLIIEGKSSEFLAIDFGAGGETVQGVVSEGPFKGCNYISVGGGGFMCCDNCNSGILPSDTCYYVAVLNRIFCKECFEDWHQRATYYQEDEPSERRNYAVTASKLASIGIEIEEEP